MLHFKKYLVECDPEYPDLQRDLNHVYNGNARLDVRVKMTVKR